MATARTAVAADAASTARSGWAIRTRNRRRSGLLAAGALVTAAGGLLGAWLVGAAGNRTDVLVVARNVPYGTVLTRDDVTVAAVSVDPLVATVPADDLDVMVGQVAAVDLVAGDLLARAKVTPDAPPGPGEVLVPLPVPGERLPVGGLRAGDRLVVADAPAVGADPPKAAPASFTVTVVRVGSPDLNGVSVLDVAAPEADGPHLAARAASGRFALIVLGPGSGQ